MDLLQNPFYILKATSRDTKERIIELSDEQSLIIDSNISSQARSDLLNPKKRLAAEISWLPGISPNRIKAILTFVETSPKSLIGLVDILPITRANLLAAGILRVRKFYVEELIVWILDIAKTFEEICYETLRRNINADRVVSEFPEIKEIKSIVSEVEELRQFYKKCIKDALDKLTTKDLIKTITTVVERATNNGEENLCPRLINDMIDSYEVEAKNFLDKEEENIKKLVDKIFRALKENVQDTFLTTMVTNLIAVVKNWDMVAQPIQISTKSRGLEHVSSKNMGVLLRNLSLVLINDYNKLEYSKQINKILNEVFAEVVDVVERTTEDKIALDEISEEFDLLTYEVNIGSILSRPFRISPNGIDWKSKIWPLNSITKVRWGGVIDQYNNTTYSITFGNESKSMSINISNQDIYSNITERLWKTVGVRLFSEYLMGLKNGEIIKFKSTLISDHGMAFNNHSTFIPWKNIVIWNQPGSFFIGKKGDEKEMAYFSYKDDDNIHILEAMIRAFWKFGGERISSLLGE